MICLCKIFTVYQIGRRYASGFNAPTIKFSMERLQLSLGSLGEVQIMNVGKLLVCNFWCVLIQEILILFVLALL